MININYNLSQKKLHYGDKTGSYFRITGSF